MVLFVTIVFQLTDCFSFSTFCHLVEDLWLLFENSSLKTYDGVTV